MEKLKNFILEYIKYYYEELDNPTGGSLHVCLDDGNLERGSIYFCLNYAKERGDSFGVFLADLMLEFTEKELEYMYRHDWKKLNKK